MKEEKKASRCRTILGRHGEKLAFGTAGALLLAYAVFGVLLANGDGDAREIQTRVSLIDAEIKTVHPGLQPPEHAPARAPDGAVFLPARTGHDPFHFASTVVRKKGAPLPRPRLSFVPLISPAAPSATLEAVTLAWISTPVTKEMEERLDVIRPEALTLERRAAGTERWEVRLPASAASFVDKGALPRTTYAYRLRAHYAGGNSTDHEFPPVRTPSPWRLTFSNPREGAVYLRIEKYDPKDGWVAITRDHAAGQRIGWWSEGPDGEPTPVHPLAIGNVRHMRDFDTGMVLVSVKTDQPHEVTLRTCTPRFEKGQQLPCEGPSAAKRPVRVTRIVFRDDEGKEQVVLQPDPVRIAWARDSLCGKHQPAK